MSKQYDYDISKVIVVVGTHSISGFVDAEMFTITLDAPENTTTVDIHGNSTITKSNNLNATCTLFLTQSSPSNSVLSNFMNAKRQNPNLGMFPVSISDGNSDTLLTSLSAWVQKAPDITYGNTPSNREWEIRLTNVAKYIGGAKSV
jgi:hypothetical protein